MKILILEWGIDGMKVYIIGSVASGKSTFAKKLSELTKVPYHGLDEVVHIKDRTNKQGNRKRPAKVRDQMFQKIIASSDYIIEDTGRECFKDGLKQADTIILIEVPLIVRYWRIIIRFIKQKIGIEKCNYKPGFAILKETLKWAKEYDKDMEELKNRLSPYQDKTKVLKNKKDRNTFLDTMSNK